jgi:hypothetical protein
MGFTGLDGGVDFPVDVGDDGPFPHWDRREIYFPPSDLGVDGIGDDHPLARCSLSLLILQSIQYNGLKFPWCAKVFKTKELQVKCSIERVCGCRTEVPGEKCRANLPLLLVPIIQGVSSDLVLADPAGGGRNGQSADWPRIPAG